LTDHENFVGTFIEKNPKPILGSQASVDPIINKILTYQLTDTEKQLINNIRLYLNKQSQSINIEEINLLIKLCLELSESDCFFAIYILRLLFLDEKTTVIIFTSSGDRIKSLIRKYVKSTFTNTLLMTTLLVMNLFSTKIGTKFLLDEMASELIGYTVDSIQKMNFNNQVLENFSKIIYNYSITFEKTLTDINTTLLISLSETLTQIDSEDFLLNKLNEETSSYLLRSFGHLVYLNIDTVTLLHDLDFSQRIKTLPLKQQKPISILEEVKKLI